MKIQALRRKNLGTDAIAMMESGERCPSPLSEDMFHRTLNQTHSNLKTEASQKRRRSLLIGDNIVQVHFEAIEDVKEI